MNSLYKTLIPLAVTLFLVAGCAAEAPKSQETTSPAETTDVTPGTAEGDEAESEAAEGDGDYAFGTDRDQIATAIEAGFKSENGKARWEGDTLVLSVDGDADKPMAGHTQCSVLSHLLNEGDLSRIEFSNGSVECADVLEQ